MSGNTSTTHRISRPGRGRTAASFTTAGCLLLAGLTLAGCSSSSSPSSSARIGGATSPSASGTAASAAASTSAPASASAASTTSGGGSGASAPFPIAVGNTWKYKTTAVGETGTSVQKMAAVVPVAAGQKVTMSTTSNLLGTNTTTHSTYIFGTDGSITYPLSQFSSTSGVSVSGGGVVWPSLAVLDSGKPSTSALTLSIKAAGQTINTTAHIAVQGGGTATVTVPAGTYQATVVNMTITMTVEGIGVSEEIKTWLAPGVGPVKDQVTVDEAGADHVAAGEELESFTKA